MFTPLEKTSYQALINLVIKGCRAALLEDIASLRLLKESGFDLSLGDYDLRAPLYFAVRGNKVESVRYLVEEGVVDVNKRDRWGGTALNYAKA